MRTAPVRIRDFRAEITDAQIADLRDRLARTRWPEPETVDDWSQGVPLSYTRDLCEYWADEYDIQRLAARLNAFPQFHATIDDLGIHFLHVRSPHEQARPLIMTHGWPGSTVEFLDVIGPLTEPEAHGGSAADAFHVVVPALPGFGFSDKQSRTGIGIERIAGAWHELMGHLGYPRYYAQGGDWGSAVTTAMAAGAFEGLLGVHLNSRWSHRRRFISWVSRPRRSGRCWPGRSGSSPRRTATRPSSPPARRRSGTRSPTPRPASSPGSWRSSTPGPTATVTRRTPSRGTSCWTTS